MAMNVADAAYGLWNAYAQTWDPMSGITVKRAVSSLRRTQAIFSSEERAAVSSTALSVRVRRLSRERMAYLKKYVYFLILFGSAWRMDRVMLRGCMSKRAVRRSAARRWTFGGAPPHLLVISGRGLPEHHREPK